MAEINKIRQKDDRGGMALTHQWRRQKDRREILIGIERKVRELCLGEIKQIICLYTCMP